MFSYDIIYLRIVFKEPPSQDTWTDQIHQPPLFKAATIDPNLLREEVGSTESETQTESVHCRQHWVSKHAAVKVSLDLKKQGKSYKDKYFAAK